MNNNHDNCNSKDTYYEDGDNNKEDGTTYEDGASTNETHKYGANYNENNPENDE